MKAQKSGPDALIKSWVFDSGLWNKLTEGERKVYVTLRRYQKGNLTIMTREELQNEVKMNRSSVCVILKSMFAKNAIKNYYKLGPAHKVLHTGAKKGAWAFHT